MNTPINEDFDKYKDDFFKGLTLRETLWGGAAALVGIFLMLFLILYLKWNSFVATGIMMPFVIVIGLNGFYNKNGMTLHTYIKRKTKILFGKALTIREPDIRNYKIKQLEQEILAEKQTKKRGSKNG